MAQAFIAPGRRAEQNWLRFRSLLPVGIVVAIAIAASVAIYPILNGQGTGTPDAITTGFGIALAVLLSVMPAVICTVQNVSLRRQRAELETLKGTAVTGTALYVTAHRTISDDAGDAWIDSDYIVPSFVYFMVCFFGFLAMFLGYGRPELFYRPTVFLGGMINSADLGSYATYQRETFSVAAMALAGAYAYSLGRILDRINNNDLYPVSLYYYSARIIIACIVASVLRHAILVLGFATPGSSDTINPLLLLLGFIVGFAPDLFILALSRKAFQVLKVWGSRPDPAEVPTSLPLLVIDDLSREKIDRLNEIGIDNAQVLAHQNPFMMLPRLPFELSLMVDWVSQAQLYTLVKDDRLAALRKLYIRNIIDLYIRLKHEGGSKAVCEALGLDIAAGPALTTQLEEDFYFMQLKELVEALHPTGSHTI